MAVTRTHTFETDGVTAGATILSSTSGRINLAKGCKVTWSIGRASATTPGYYNLTRVTDGDLNTANYISMLPVRSSYGWCQVDLGAVKVIDTVRVWHYYGDPGRVYHKTLTQVSSDGKTWVNVYNYRFHGTYAETSGGKAIGFTPRPVRYIRDWVSGNTTNDINHWLEIQAFGDDVGGGQFDGVFAAPTYSSTAMHGSLGMSAPLVAYPNSGVRWNWPAASTSAAYLRAYVRPASAPFSYNASFFTAFSTLGVAVAGIGFGSNGKFRIADSVGAVTSSAMSYAANTWYRVEARIKFSATVGQAEVRIYDQDSTIPLETVTTPATRNFPVPGEWQFGNGAAAPSTGTIHLDDIGMSDVGWFGPSDTDSTKVNNFENGVPGTTVVAADSGGASGDPFETVSIGSGSTLTYHPVSIHGGLGLKATLAASSTATVRWPWRYGPTIYLRAYVRTPAAPFTYTAYPIRGEGNQFYIGFGPSGLWALYDANSTETASSTTYQADTWYRLEARITCSATAGQIVLRIYAGDSRIPLEEVTTPANRNIPVPPGILFGNDSTAGAVSGTIYLDDVATSVRDWLGPSAWLDPTVATGNEPGNIALRMCAMDGTVLGLLPLAAAVKTLEEFNGVGSLTFDYPKTGPSAELLEQLAGYFVLVEGGRERPDYYLLDADGEQPTDAAGAARMITTQHPGFLKYLDYAITYPGTHVAGGAVAGLAPDYKFATSTPGFILKTLIDKAKARGALPYLDYDFTGNVDSVGTTWPTSYSIDVPTGRSLLQVVQDMVDARWIDVRTEGTTLRAWVPDTYYGLDRPDAVLRIGREVISGPRQRARSVVRSHILSVGEEGAAAEAANATTVTQYGERREAFDARGSITDVGTLTAVAQAVQAGVADAPEAITVEFDPHASPGTPRIGVDFRLGDKIRYDVYRIDATNLEPLRVRSIASEWQGIRKQVSLELNDQFTELTAALNRRIDGLLNGSSANERAPQDPAVPDFIKPNAPASVSVTTDAYVAPDGRTLAQATISWPQVTTNEDGTAYDDHGHYGVRWQINGGDWTGEVIQGAPPVHVSGLNPGATFRAGVRAVDQSGAASALTLSGTVTLASDTTPPPVPSTPVAAAWMGGIRVTWDGLGSAGQAMPFDFDRVEVHRSTSSGFTPSSATLVDNLRAAGVSPHFGLVYGTTYYFKLISVDASGNKSAASSQASATAAQVVSADVFDGAIGSAKLADLAVITAKMDNLAANDAKIGSVSAGKIITSTLSADVVVAGKITTATTASRMEMTGTGLRLYQQIAGIDYLKLHIDPTVGQLRIYNTTDVSLTSTGHGIQLGDTAAINLVIDNNEIQVRNNGASEFLGLNINGGNVQIGASMFVTDDGMRALATAAAMHAITWGEGSNQSVTSTTYSGGSPFVSVGFTGPPSGRVLVIVGAACEGGAAGDNVEVSYEIRNTNSGGSIWQPATAENGVDVQGTDYVRACNVSFVAGLTPGNPYYVRTMHRRFGAAAGTVFDRSITVVPLL